MFKATKLLKKSSNESLKKTFKMKILNDVVQQNHHSDEVIASVSVNNTADSNLAENSEQLFNFTLNGHQHDVSVTNSANASSTDKSEQALKKFSLKGNQLNGSILIGNYNYLTQLEVSENEMEVLDLSSLAQLETLKCMHNKLMELMINGSNLTSLLAANNCLHQINITPTPHKLCHVNISNNYFTVLPNWLNDCELLNHLDASHNQLQHITNFILASKTVHLKILNISYNCLRIIERLPQRFATLQYLHLHCNGLQLLADNLFAITSSSLKELNLSGNKLQVLPSVSQRSASYNATDDEPPMVLEVLRLSNNNFDHRIFDVLQNAKHLRILHAAYNKISKIPDAFVRTSVELQNLMLSGNLLQQLPTDLGKLSQLQVLRVHSNLLLSVPCLNKMEKLRVLDLAHNHLDHLNLLNIMPKNLKYLDLSCNMQLQVDEQQVKVCRSQRKWRLVDVSGRNRSNLPTACQRHRKEEQLLHKTPWLVGFSETPGNCRKLLVIQLRESKFRQDEGLFGMFASEVTASASATKMSKVIPKLLQQNRAVKENIGSYMKYTLLATQKKLLDQPVVGANLCYISRENNRCKDFVRSQKTKSYVLHVAGFGNIGVYLIRKTTNVQLLVPHETSADVLKQEPNHLPDPSTAEWILTNDDEYLVICNSGIWSIMDMDRIAREIRKEDNVVLAAKRLQDMTQSFGGEENLSVIVVRFKNIGTDVDHLIKELKQTVRKSPQSWTNSTITENCPNLCKRLCYDRNISGRYRLGSSRPLVRLGSPSERSSPSGQSDPALSASTYKPDHKDEYILAHARVLEETTEMETLDESDSALSEEQFKCWEYMLEQNTQLLFDKELNTISKSFTANRNLERKTLNTPETFDCAKTNLVKTNNHRFISTSSPQLVYAEVKKPLAFAFNPNSYHQQSSLLSKHFGSARSFGTTYGRFGLDNKNRDSLPSCNYSKLGGGPNAAYFGSLQRLMPYNLEYDFNLMRERSILDEDDEEFSEHDNRMSKYWGVATTEL